MVDVQPTNEKLVNRAQRIIMEATGCDRETASKALDLAEKNVKAAIIMILLNCSYDEAIEKLEAADGFVRKVILTNRRENP